MFCIILDFEIKDKTVIKELGTFIDRKVQGYSLSHPKKYNPTKQSFWSTRNLDRIFQNSGCLKYSELPNVLPRAAKGKNFARGTKNYKFLDNLLEEEIKNFNCHGCRKN